MEFTTPIACLTCANIGGEDLPQVESELNAIRSALQPLHVAAYLNIPDPLFNVGSSDIYEMFINNRDAIQVFHFAGHANGEKIILESGGRAEGLSGLFGLQKNLALVFLNGCNSEGQAQLYLDAGVKVVLATIAKIKDEDAPVFAAKFYEALASGQSIRHSYIAASSILASASTNYRKAKEDDIVIYRAGGFDNSNIEPVLPWRLFVNDGFEHHLEWKFTQETAVMNRLRSGSKLYYHELKERRYKHVQIENILLSEMQGKRSNGTLEEVLFDTTVIISRPDNPSEEIPLLESLTELWKESVPHLLLRGEGGTGKTVSTLKLWEEYVKQASVDTPIPVFIAMNEYNHHSKDNDTVQKDFLLNYIAEKYLGAALLNLNEAEKNALIANLKKPLTTKPFKPSVLLFLDGMNEVTVDNESLTNLWLSLQELIAAAVGIQIVMTSRYDSRNFEFAKNFNLVEIQPLRQEKVEQYLADKKVVINEMSEEVRQNLLRNPMMLTLLAASSELVEQYKDNTEHFEFKQPVSSAGEVLWNFMEAQLAKYLRDDDVHKNQFVASRLMLHHVLPYLGYEMERNGLFSIRAELLEDLIKRFMVEIETDAFLDTFRYFNTYLEQLGTELYVGTENAIIRRTQVEKVKIYLLERLQMLVMEGEIRFLHQNFRDFFAAVHIINEMKKGKAKNVFQPAVLCERPIPIYVRTYLAELLGLHRRKPFYETVTDKYVLPTWPKDDFFSLFLEKNRSIFDWDITGYLILNCIELLKTGKGELTGEDLSRLNFERLSLNGIRCGRIDLPITSFNGGKFAHENIFPQGSNGDVESVQFNASSTRYLTFSEGELNVWSIPEHYCIYSDEGLEFAGFWSDEEVVYCKNRTVYKKNIHSNEPTVLLEMENTGEGNLKLSHYGRFLMESIENAVEDGIKVAQKQKEKFEIVVWDLEKKSPIGRLSGLEFDLFTAEFEMDSLGQQFFIAQESTVLAYSIHDSSLKFKWKGAKSLRIASIALENTKKIIALGSFNGDVCLLSFDGTKNQTLPNPEIVIEDDDLGGIVSLTFSKDSQFLYAAGGSKSIYKWSLDQLKLINRIPVAHNDLISALDISGDGKTLISGSGDYSTKIWSQDGLCLHTIPPNGRVTYGLDISPDGQFIAMGCADYCIKIYSIEKGCFVKVFEGHTSYVWTVAFHPTLPLLYSSAADDSTKIWDLNSNKCRLSKMTNLLQHIRFSPSAIQFVGRTRLGDEFLIYNAETLEYLGGFKPTDYENGDLTDIIDFIDEETLIVGAPKTLFEWHFAIKNTIHRKTLFTKGGSPIFHLKKNLLLTGFNYDKQFNLYDLQTAALQKTRPISSIKSKDYCNIKKFSPDGRFAVLGRNYGLTCWDIESDKTYDSAVNHLNHILDLKIAVDNRFAVTTSWDNTIKIWSIPSLECIISIPSEALLLVECCDFSNLHPDSTLSQEDKKKLALYGTVI